MEKIMMIVGPTASGKTAMSIEMAKKYDGEIISADSVQIYKGLDIGSAKILPEEMQGITHHMIDIVSPFEAYSVSDYKKAVKECIRDVIKRGKMPIIAGGTGFYIHSVLYDMDFQAVSPNESLREELTAFAQEKGAMALYDKLSALNSELAQNVHPNNVKRVIRAIEIALSSKKTSDFKTFEQNATLNYDVDMRVLTMPREKLYERINLRVDKMMDDGLVDEVKNLVKMGLDRSFQSMSSIGYKEIIAYLEGESSLEQAIALIKQKSRNYAKRQLTWFKKYKFANWLDVTSGNITQHMS